MFWVFDMLLIFDLDIIQGRSVRTINCGGRVIGAGRRLFVFFDDRDVSSDLEADWGHRLLLAISVTSALALALLAFAARPGRDGRGSAG
ncbi:MAG TPA: hypothetical protein VIF44_04990 [Candidatus Limnocylindrales bacterium]